MHSGAIPASAILSGKGIARYGGGGIWHWAAKLTTCGQGRGFLSIGCANVLSGITFGTGASGGATDAGQGALTCACLQVHGSLLPGSDWKELFKKCPLVRGVLTAHVRDTSQKAWKYTCDVLFKQAQKQSTNPNF